MKKTIMDDSVRKLLHNVIKEHGINLCNEIESCEGFLRDYLNKNELELNLILLALKEGIPSALQKNTGDKTLEIILENSIELLEKNYAIKRVEAIWTVLTWAFALDLTDERRYQTLEKKLNISRNNPTSSVHPGSTKAKHSISKIASIVLGSMIGVALVIITTLVLQPKYGKLEIVSSPSDAIIYLNGQNTGDKTPKTFQKLRVGTYSIKLVKYGYSDWESDVIIRKKTTIYKEVHLQSNSGKLNVTSNPSGATIWLDGSNTGEQTPHLFEDLSEGKHIIKLTNQGFVPQTQEVRISLGETNNIYLHLPKKEISGCITVNNVNVRDAPSINANVIDRLNQNDRIAVLDHVSSRNSDEGITVEKTFIILNNNRNVSINKSVAVKITGSTKSYYFVTVKTDDGENICGKIPKNTVRLIQGSKWYKIRTNSGLTGWVFGDFVSL